MEILCVLVMSFVCVCMHVCGYVFWCACICHLCVMSCEALSDMQTDVQSTCMCSCWCVPGCVVLCHRPEGTGLFHKAEEMASPQSLWERVLSGFLSSMDLIYEVFLPLLLAEH